MADPWDPALYERFRAEREAPFRDLLALVRLPLVSDGPAGAGRPARALDLGCGTGRLTRELARALGPGARVLGVDASQAMLDEARERAGDGVAFARGDGRDFEPPAELLPLDLALSNAALHWMGDQRAALARLRGWLGPGGQLAVQVPASFDHATHTVAAAVAREAPFAAELGGFEVGRPVLAPAEYARALFELGFAEQHVRLQVYPHVLPSSADAAEWVRGTLLTAYLSRLAPESGERFLARYRERLLAELGQQRPYFHPFERILLWGRLP